MTDQTPRGERESLTTILQNASRDMAAERRGEYPPSESPIAPAAVRSAPPAHFDLDPRPEETRSMPPTYHNQEESGERFVQISDNLAEVMLEAARAQLTMAENNYREVEAFVDELRHSIKKKHAEYLALVRKLEDFSQEMLQMHSRFHSSGAGGGNNGAKR